MAILAALVRADASSPVEAWRAEIEARSGRPVVIVECAPDDWLPHPGLAGYWVDAFRAEFGRAHALTLNTPAGQFVLLNTAYALVWADSREELLAHELGHAWLAAEGYHAPPYTAGPGACLAIHTGDVVQHVLLRAEMRRRGISGLRYWLRNLEQIRADLAAGRLREPLDPCQRLVLLNQWCDFRLSLPEPAWSRAGELHERLTDRFPNLARVQARVEAAVRSGVPDCRDCFAHLLGTVRLLLEEAYGAP